MKRSWFDGGLYREGLRQLQVIGILSLVLLTLAAVLAPVGRAVNISSVEAACLATGETFRPETLTFLSSHPLLVLCFPVLAPVMSLYLFHILDRREACDFYHSIPQTRGCLFVSLTAALFTWLLAILLVSSLVNLAVCQLLGRYLTLTFRSIPPLLLNLTAATLLVSAAVLLAMSLTGTLFTNMVVALLILFLPRAILLAVTICLSSAMPYVSSSHLFPFLDYSWNVVAGVIIGCFDGTAGDVIYRWQSGVYTLVLALLYLVLAGVCFVRRKSEAAGQAAPSRRLQLAFRLAVSLTVCLIPMGMIFDFLAGGSEIGGSWLFTLLVLYLIAVIAYFLYELIATRKLRNLTRAVPGLGMLAGLNLLLIFGMFGIYRYTSSQQPEAEEISYVSLQADRTVWVITSSSSQSEQQMSPYFDTLLEDVQLDSPEVRNMVSQRLRQTIEYYSGSGDLEANRLFGSGNTWSCLLRIQAGNKALYRNVYLTEADLQLLKRNLQQKPEVQEIYQNLPPDEERETTVSSGKLSDAAAGRVYETLRAEVAEMDFSQWYSLVEGTDQTSGNTVVAYLSMSTYWNSQWLGTDLPISTAMPETFRTFMEEYQAAMESSTEDLLQALGDGSAFLVGLYCSGYEEGRFAFYGNRDFNFDPYAEEWEGMEEDAEEAVEDLTEEEAVSHLAWNSDVDETQERQESQQAGAALKQMLDQRLGEPVEAGKDFLSLEISSYVGGEYRYLPLYVAAGREDIPQELQELMDFSEVAAVRARSS